MDYPFAAGKGTRIMKNDDIMVNAQVYFKEHPERDLVFASESLEGSAVAFDKTDSSSLLSMATDAYFAKYEGKP